MPRGGGLHDAPWGSRVPPGPLGRSAGLVPFRGRSRGPTGDHRRPVPGCDRHLVGLGRRRAMVSLTSLPGAGKRPGAGRHRLCHSRSASPAGGGQQCPHVSPGVASRYPRAPGYFRRCPWATPRGTPKGRGHRRWYPKGAPGVPPRVPREAPPGVHGGTPRAPRGYMMVHGGTPGIPWGYYGVLPVACAPSSSLCARPLLIPIHPLHLSL